MQAPVTTQEQTIMVSHKCNFVENILAKQTNAMVLVLSMSFADFCPIFRVVILNIEYSPWEIIYNSKHSD